MRLLPLVIVVLLASCAKKSDPAPSVTAEEPKKEKEKEKDTAKSAAADPPKGEKSPPATLTPEEYCDAIGKLASEKPPAKDLAACVAEASKRKDTYPDRYACQVRCVSAAKELETARNCHSMCGDVKTVCAAVKAKSACETRLGKIFRGEVEPTAYACFAKCINKSPENASGLEKTIDCLGTDCKL